MDDSREAQRALGTDTGESPRSRVSMAETLQQALRALGRDGTSLTPETLTALAHRAGVTDERQIADLARMMGMSASAAASADEPQHILFAVGDMECALPAEAVQGVERVGEVAQVPNTVPWVLGIIHLHGSIVSVVDLRGFFGMPAQPVTPRTRLLVVTRQDMTIGFVVDGVTEMRSLNTGNVLEAPHTAVPAWATPYVQRPLSIEGRTVLLLDPALLLFSDKMHAYRADFS
jgi:purine-binding chemotaxis protein CheW